MGASDGPKALDLVTLKKLYGKLINENTKNLIEWTDQAVSYLTNAAVQNYGSAADEDVIQRKSYALRCLNISPIKLTDDFYQSLLDSLLDFIESLNPTLISSPGCKNLEKHIRSSKNNKTKLAFLNTLMICFAESNVNFAIFEHFSPNEWRKELLTFVLFKDIDADLGTIQSILDKINNCNLEKTKTNKNEALEDVLEVLVCNKKEHAFDIHFINDIFFLIVRKPELIELLNNFTSIQQHIQGIKMDLLSAHYSFFPGFDSSKLEYFSKYPFAVLHILLTKESEDFKQLILFKQLLEYSKMDLPSQIKLLMKLNPKESFYKWKHDVAFEIVRDVISVIFSAYEKYSRRQHKVSKNVYLVSQSKMQCTCFESKCRFHNTTECCDLLYNLNSAIARVIFNCCTVSDALIEIVGSLIANMTKAARIVGLTRALDTLEEYDIQFTDVELETFFYEMDADNYEREVHKYVVRKSFPGSYEKTVDQLLDEIEELYPGVTYPIVEMFDEVQMRYKNESVLFPDEGSIKNWNKKQIEKWAQLVKRKENTCKVPDEEILAVIKLAAQKTVKLELRHIQMMSVLLMIKSYKGRGRLCQINTGEGKTLIIAALAAFEVFKGHAVDVFTSSPLLAIPQSQEYEDFYKILNITVTNNILHNSDYTCDVIYGTNNSFQRDVLLDEFRKTGVRDGRKFDIAIVDEVDNMLIDGNNWILLLSCDMPAMDYLEVLLAAIYIQVNEAAGSLIERDGKTYYLVQETALNDDGSVKPEISVEEVPIEGSKRDFIIKCTESHLRKLIRDKDFCKDIEEGYPEVKIPNHLREVICKSHLKRWISNAVSAIFRYVKDEDYILKDGKVTIVDADNTGVMKKNSTWTAGLHQFLQIKHGAKVDPENFTTNFISNVGLFTRYSTKLFGLTGTLGSSESKSFLQTTYDVDSVVVPPFKLKQHKQLKPILVSNNEDKYIETAKSCIRKLNQGQAALIIMKYIRETEELAQVFINEFNYDKSKVKLVKTDDDSEVLQKSLQPGEVIITTNIAGRGTDVKLDKGVEENGGLHVCLTFLPVNSRVEHQNIGRTSRKGNRGTSQLVVNDPQCLCDIEALKKVRNRLEAKKMSEASKTVKRVKTKDRIFRQFCELLDEIKGRNINTKKTEQTAAEERFAIWLVMNEDKLDDDSNDIDKSFEAFRNEILNDDKNNDLIKNPCMLIDLGNKYLEKKYYEKAIHEYDRAIVLDHTFSEYAYYNRAWAYLAKYGGNMSKHDDCINQAVRDLKKARKLIEEKEYCLHLLQTASKGEVFSDQITHKLNLYNLHKSAIELAIGPDTDAINAQIKKLEADVNNNNLDADTRKKMEEMLKNLREHSKEIGTIGRAKLKNRNIEVNSLGDDFMLPEDVESHKDELKEFKRNGWMGGFKVTEVKPIDWKSVLSLLGIGLGQLLIGAALTVFTLGAGATIGMGLISEGISDIITAIKDGIINRDFDWAMWALMKVISIAVSVVCAGFKAIKDAAKTAYAGAKNVVSSGVRALTQTTKHGWKLVAKKIGLEMAKGVAKEIATDLVGLGLDKTVMPLIEEAITEHVRVPIQNALLQNSKVAIMLKLDLQNGNHNYENQIRATAQKILSPDKNSLLMEVSKKIVTSFAENKGYALTMKACVGLVGIKELVTFTSDFINKMTEEINNIKIDEKLDTSDTTDANDEESNEILNELEESMYQETEDDIDLSKVGQSEEQIKLNRKPRTTSHLSGEISGMVSRNMMQILKGKIVMPVAQLGVSYSVDKISSRVHESLEKQMENYRSLKNVIHAQNKAYKNNHNDTSNSYSVEEMEKVDKIINKVRDGGPAGLAHLGAISDVTDRPIEVYDEKGRLKYTIGDTKKAKPIEIQFHPPEDGSDVGHFTLKGQREPFQTGNADNMCLFNVVAEQTGLNPNDLKKNTLDVMENNKHTVAKQVKHINRLEMYEKSSLLEGGAQYNGTCPDHAKQFLRNSNGVIGFTNIVPGHADIHIPFKRKTEDHLRALAQETGRQIEVYDKNGDLAYLYGTKKDGTDPIKLQYHKPKGDTSGECFTSLGGKERYYLHDPNDMTLYNIVGKQTGRDASVLKNATIKIMDNKPVPRDKKCLENETKEPLSGFASEDEQAFVFHYAMQTDAVKQILDEMNQYKPGVKGKKFTSQAVRLSAKELNLPRKAFGGNWKQGNLERSWPVTEVLIKFQHYEGHANNPKARVHIQTFFPYPPKHL